MRTGKSEQGAIPLPRPLPTSPVYFRWEHVR